MAVYGEMATKMMSGHFIDQEWTQDIILETCLTPFHLLLYLDLSFDHHHPFFFQLLFLSVSLLSTSPSFTSVFFTLLCFHSLSWPPLFFSNPSMSLSLSPAEVQSQGFCLLVIYFPISPLSEVHALGLSVCGGHWGPPKRKTHRVEERRAPWTHW